MATFGKRIFDTTTLVEQRMSEKAAQPVAPGEGTPAPVRTAPGRLMQTNSQIVELQAELAQMRQRMEQWDNSMPATYLDPAKVERSKVAKRHMKSFLTPEFARLKESIKAAGGNVQPILVVPKAGEEQGYVLVYGHRRLEACLQLGLPVLALIWDKPLTHEAHFLAMERENREKSDLSAYETGVMYLNALDEKEGFFRSERHLAEVIGVSRRWIQKVLLVARLPPAIVESFESPLDIKPAHAEVLQAALDENAKAVLKRAEAVRQRENKLDASKVVAALLGIKKGATPAKNMSAVGGVFGTWKRDTQGRAIFTVNSGLLDDAQTAAVVEAIARVLADK